MTPQSEPRFPSPLELDRLLREPHPLLGAAEKFREISSAGLPNIELLPAHATSCQINSVGVLLEHELKLHDFFAEQNNGQVDNALALLYWLATEPDQPFG
ncbi:hypothetical protein ACQ4M4_05965 [Leptolyngbya sp. AN02str]|uniref:hypothetical protein n=1 Tax=Leptolyngbya sp. AN02str TaxID=3423363 RepID=UPI003D3103C9